MKIIESHVNTLQRASTTEKMLDIQVEKMTYSVDEIYLLSSVTLFPCLLAQWTHMQNCQGSMYQTAMVVQGESNHGLDLIQLIWILPGFIFSASVPANTTTCGINSPPHF